MFCISAASAGVKMNLADGFDFPVGKPDAAGYYKSRGLRLRSPRHFGEDWNSREGGNSDLGDPVYSIGDGVVTFAHNVRGAWGQVVLVRHGYRDSVDKKVRFVDSLYAHLDKTSVKTGQIVKRGQQVGTIGTNYGMYTAHLHFEIRHNIQIGLSNSGASPDLTNWADPTQFINKYRSLKPEWKKVDYPTGTYRVYAGFTGL